MRSKVRLGGRNLFYSMVLAGCMLTFLVGYFVYMLPSLYVDYTMEQNLQSVRMQHKMYVQSGSYADVQVKNPTACFSIKIPNTEDSVYLATKFFSVKVVVEDPKIKEIFAEFRSLLRAYGQHSDDEDGYEKFAGKAGEWRGMLSESFRDIFSSAEQLPFQIQILEQTGTEDAYSGEYSRIHWISDDFMILESGVRDRSNQYINYIAVQRTGEGMVLSFLPVVTPDMNEIRPVVFQSLPMLGMVKIRGA